MKTRHIIATLIVVTLGSLFYFTARIPAVAQAPSISSADYLVIENVNVVAFSKEVSSKIRTGYSLHGELIVLQGGSGAATTYIQALEKNK